MSEISDALTQLATVLDGLSTNPNNVWVWETEHDNISMDDLPVIVVSQADSMWHSIDAGGAFARGRNVTEAYISIYLERGFLDPAKPSDTAPPLAHPWQKALFDVLMANKKLNNTVMSIGDERGLLAYRLSNIRWRDETYWGIFCVLPLVVEYV